MAPYKPYRQCETGSPGEIRTRVEGSQALARGSGGGPNGGLRSADGCGAGVRREGEERPQGLGQYKGVRPRVRRVIT